MKKKTRLLLVVTTLFLIIMVVFYHDSKPKVDRKQREEFKKELLTYQHNIDFFNYETKQNTLSVLGVDIIEVFETCNNDLYFDEDEFDEFAKDIEDIIYDEQDILEFTI